MSRQEGGVSSHRQQSTSAPRHEVDSVGTAKERDKKEQPKELESELALHADEGKDESTAEVSEQADMCVHVDCFTALFLPPPPPLLPLLSHSLSRPVARIF